ncbi:amidohydrolase [Actinomadura roseirufa]|uniref:amidohydrolase n=1 Tax=Actinomadura roseirufa TaxID=2094049 RepID=UPI0013F17168|nr:amidohydrolase [Actinomadura roseirufa]
MDGTGNLDATLFPEPAGPGGADSGDDRTRVFHAAHVLADGGARPTAFAVAHDVVVAVGDSAELRSRFPDGDHVDLGGALVTPGFNDAHCHPSVTAENRLRLDVSAGVVDSLADIKARLSGLAATTAPGEWVIAAGYDPARTEPGQRLDRWSLDEISRTQPVAVIVFNWHIAVVNSAALEAIGYDRDTRDPVGGELGRAVDGELDGWLYEQAFLLPFWAGTGRAPWVREPDLPALVDALVEENEYLHSLGITSYCDAIVTPNVWGVYAQARAEGRLTPRVGMLLWYTYFETARELGITAGFGDDRLRYVGIKTMHDGAISGGTCLCRQPYASATGKDNGIQLVDDGEFDDLVERVHAAGDRICVHANGDLAIQKVLDAVEAAQRKHPHQRRINHRIEHASMADRELMGRIRAAGVTPVPFGGLMRQYGDQVTRFYGLEQAERTLPHRSFLEEGIPVAGSSDYPVTPPSPLVAMQSMTTRTTVNGNLLGGDQRIDVRDALAIYTRGSAHATGESGRKGRLVPGQLADFVVLDTDITAAPERIGETRVLSTWVGGQQVWAG